VKKKIKRKIRRFEKEYPEIAFAISYTLLVIVYVLLEMIFVL
jgi:hypothetical protein